MTPSDRIPADRVEAAAQALTEAYDWIGGDGQLAEIVAKRILVASGYESDLAARDQRIKELETMAGLWPDEAEDRVRVLEAENERLRVFAESLEALDAEGSVETRRTITLEKIIAEARAVLSVQSGELSGKEGKG